MNLKNYPKKLKLLKWRQFRKLKCKHFSSPVNWFKYVNNGLLRLRTPPRVSPANPLVQKLLGHLSSTPNIQECCQINIQNNQNPSMSLDLKFYTKPTQIFNILYPLRPFNTNVSNLATILCQLFWKLCQLCQLSQLCQLFWTFCVDCSEI